MSGQFNYWLEAIEAAMEDADARDVWQSLTPEQCKRIASVLEGAHENYGMAFYSPPASDRLSGIEREWKAKLDAKDRELDRCRRNAEAAVSRAMKLPHGSNISINDRGDVYRHDGRREQIL